MKQHFCPLPWKDNEVQRVMCFFMFLSYKLNHFALLDVELRFSVLLWLSNWLIKKCTTKNKWIEIIVICGLVALLLIDLEDFHPPIFTVVMVGNNDRNTVQLNFWKHSGNSFFLGAWKVIACCCVETMRRNPLGILKLSSTTKTSCSLSPFMW